ncbi:MAG TPA: hypothetical protein VLX89_04000 [Actinomycetota bacterium]|nr:hypothetical protein [Actinomycetota bacterium]
MTATRRLQLIAVKAVHSVLFFAIGGCLVYFLAAGIARRSDRRAALAGAVVAGEALIYATNGMRCPLSDLAEDLGAEDGSVGDIYLPRPLREHLPAITGPMFGVAIGLHAWNILARRRSTMVTTRLEGARDALDRDADGDGGAAGRTGERPGDAPSEHLLQRHR